MSTNGKVRAVAVILSGIALVAALFGALFMINGSFGFARCSGVMGCGWMVPLLAGIVIVALLWVLSVQVPKYKEADADLGALCGSCGAQVMDGWRLCPSCGSRLGE